MVNLQKESLIDRLIWLVFLTLAIATPIIFTNLNTELYEVPKMSLVYFASSLLLTLTAAKFIVQKKITLPKTPILTLLLAFIAAQITSTIISLDKFTSIYGYPTRLNGGLISQFSYLVIFTSALINLNSQKVIRLIITAIVTAFTVSIIGILSHFNLDLTCLVITGDVSSSCWQAEFNPTLRIFSTLGQPNWLATYLVLVIPFSLSILFLSKRKTQKVILSLISFSLILALIFTGSRSGFAGLIFALLIFISLNAKSLMQKNRKVFLSSIFLFLMLLIIFGSPLLIRLGDSLTRQKTVPGGTETGQIRLIVWQGAIEAFKKSPILGNGPESFAYSYAMNRPLAHNQTTEWNFFYNKAHNELLNYLANIGILGTSTYLLFLLASLISIFKVSRSKDKINSSFAKAAFAAIIGYHVAIFFGFSTVVSQLMMFLLITFILILGNIKFFEKELPLNKIGQKIVLVVSLLIGLWIISFSARIYLADVFFNRSKNLEGNNSIRAVFNAIDTYPSKNPFYLSDFAQSSATFATNFEDDKAKKLFSESAQTFAEKSFQSAPNNFIIVRRLINAYILLSSIDNKYQDQLSLLQQKLIKLSPTDPQTYLTSAKIELALGNQQKAREYLDLALKLKPDYAEAQELIKDL